MLDGFTVIITYTIQHQKVASTSNSFLNNYVFGFWFVRMHPEKCAVCNRYKLTNRVPNYYDRSSV